LAGGLLLAFVLGLTACAEKQPLPDSPALAQDCLWVLWIKDSQLAKEAGAQISRGRSLTLVARELVRQGPETATLDTGCPTLSELPLGVVDAGRPLTLGQVSPPLELRGGTAFVMRGTDRYRLLSLSLYAKQHYQEAQEAALQDLALNPANTASWLLLGRSRAASGDATGALKAYEQGLLIDHRDMALQNAKRDLAQGESRGQTPPPPLSKPASPAATPQAPPASPAPQGASPAPAASAAAGLPADLEQINPHAEEARQMLTMATQMAKDNRDPAQAEQLARKATKLDPKLAPAWVLLGKLQEAKGQNSEATMSFHQAAALDPANEEANAGVSRNFMALDKVRVARMGAETEPPAPIERGMLPDAPKKTIARGTVPDAPTPPGKWDVFIQVASIKGQAAAQAEARAWSRRGFNTRIWSWEGPDGSTWQRVLVGPYPTHEKARSIAQDLKGKGTLSFFSLVDFPRN
jgi:tetratricopeptide (TPR) repeat protein